MTMEKNLDKELEQLGRTLAPEPSLKRAVLTQLAELPAPQVQPLNIGRRIMRSPITRLCTAAIFVVALLLVYHLPGNRTSLAWGDVVRKLEQIQTFRYRERSIKTSSARKEGFSFKSEHEKIVRGSKQWGRRSDSYYDGKLGVRTFTNLAQKRMTSLFSGMNRYSVHPLAATEYLQRDDPHRMVIHCINKASRIHALGTELIEDVLCEGIAIRDPNVFYWGEDTPEEFAMRIWVDIETDLPIWIEKEFRMPGQSWRSLRIMDQFEWNVQLDPKLFEPNIPSDYTLMEFDPPREKSLAGVKPEVTAQVAIPDVNTITLLGVERTEPGQSVQLTEMKEVANIQDKITEAWPDYHQVQETLAPELLEKLGIDDLSPEQIRATAVALRERFWQEGGCLSETSYPYVYASRLLLERLHQETPTDLAVTDELVETLQSTAFILSYDPVTGDVYRHQAVLDDLAELRFPQFEQIERELASGRAVEWADLVRVNDIAFLYGKADQYDMGLEKTQWLIDHAVPGKWTFYLKELRYMHDCYSRDLRTGVSLYENTKIVYPEEFRYRRRLYSFKGPARRGAVPFHLLDGNRVSR